MANRGEGKRVNPDVSEESYYLAYLLVRQAEQHLERGTHHYWTKAGCLIGTLDELVRVILEGNLLAVDKGDLVARANQNSTGDKK